MPVENDFGADSWWELPLQLDEQATQCRIVRALPPTMQEVVPVDQHEFDAVEGPAATHEA